MPAAEPPITKSSATQRATQGFLRLGTGESGPRRVQRHQLSRAVRQREQVAADKLPEIGGGVLDGRLVLGRHHRLQTGKVGQQGRRPRQRVLTLALKVLERHHGVREAFEDFISHLEPDAVPQRP